MNISNQQTKQHPDDDNFIERLTHLIDAPPPVDTSKLKPMSANALIKVLGLTIKNDEANKLVAFLCMLSAYTQQSQLNLSFNAPSSSGKSFIPLEIAKLFPAEDIMELGYASPTSFFHSAWEFNKTTQEYTVDLSRKVIIFLDQPHTMLLEHLRPLLSHDKQIIHIQITDKAQKHGLRAKKIALKGYPAVVFCSAGLQLDEQEATRFLLLSPEIDQEKIRAGILESLKKNADPAAYNRQLEENPDRILLKERIRAIRQEEIEDVRISNPAAIEKRFFGVAKVLKPRHQRDIKRLITLVKIFALLNLWWREREGSILLAHEEDFEEAWKVWEKVSLAQELNIPPFLYNLYEKIIVAAFKDKNTESEMTLGISRQEVMQKHYAVYGRMLDATYLRQQILPMLNQAGLIVEEVSPNDKRAKLIYPQSPINSEGSGGVDKND